MTTPPGLYNEIAELQLAEFRRQLTAVRERLGLSQTRLGQAIGVTGRAIGYLETGQRDTRVTTILAIIAYFNDTHGIALTFQERPQ